eukprot:TRINITY_DN5828_c0_g1_i1.p1 TRINITY_DN5828_c0_g1~~TRINITY_DN5828_c0_g1_i1.p1  ORF type:complete len:229 (-),score=92.32 TRINITY_DN5828_c0_g1_i1:103-789(-)
MAGYKTAAPTRNVEVALDAAEGDDFEDIVDSPYAQGGPSGSPLDGEGDRPEEAEKEFTISDTKTASAEDKAFDAIVEALQEIVMSDAFQDTLDKFCKANCRHFEDTEENKLIYTDLHNEYSELIENYLEEKLTAKVKGFSMAAFLDDLVQRGEEEIDHAVFDMLMSLAEFDAFKQQMLTYGAKKTDLGINGVASTLHQDEVEDGEIRKDLEDLLIIAPASPNSKAKPN